MRKLNKDLFRMKWDSNPRYYINSTPAFKTSTINRSDIHPLMFLSERMGFEPMIQIVMYIGIANQRLKPLGHLSLFVIIYYIMKKNKKNKKRTFKKKRSVLGFKLNNSIRNQILKEEPLSHQIFLLLTK